MAGLATAKFGGITLSSALTSSKKTLELFGADGTTVKIVAAIMIVFMAITVYITQHQIMSRGGPVDPQQQKIQRIMLYGSPLLLAIFGLRFPIAVLVYWLVTNTWSMAQQVFILRKMPPVLAGTAASAAIDRAARVHPPRACGRERRHRRPRRRPSSVRSEIPSPRTVPAATGSRCRRTNRPSPMSPTTRPHHPRAMGRAAAPRTAAIRARRSGGRTVSGGGGQGNRPRPNNRPAAKSRGKGPRKGGRR